MRRCSRFDPTSLKVFRDLLELIRLLLVLLRLLGLLRVLVLLLLLLVLLLILLRLLVLLLKVVLSRLHLLHLWTVPFHMRPIAYPACSLEALASLPTATIAAAIITTAAVVTEVWFVILPVRIPEAHEHRVAALAAEFTFLNRCTCRFCFWRLLVLLMHLPFLLLYAFSL